MAKQQTATEMITTARQETAQKLQYRADLDKRVEAAQNEYRYFLMRGLGSSAASKQAEQLRDQLESELIALDTELQMRRAVQTVKLPYITVLIERQKSWKVALHNAAACGSATGVAMAVAELESIANEMNKHRNSL